MQILILFLSTAPLLFFFSSLIFFLQWRSPKGKTLPPGSMGWPYIGETLKFYSQNPDTFFSNKQKRYGDIFKTHILGCPCILISSPEAAKFVLLSRAHLFKPTFPPSKERMIGPEALFFHQGDYHSKLRKLVQASFFPSAIRGSVSEIEQLVLKLVSSWENRTVNALQEMKRFAFDVAILVIFGRNRDLELEEIKRLYYCLEQGYNSMPLNLPGTPFHKSMKARKQLNGILRRTIERRREEKKVNGGLLGVLLSSDAEKAVQLTDAQIADNIIGVIFAAQGTTASFLTWILKYLTDNLDHLDSVTVIQETLRAASVLSFTFREAVEDVEFEGYLIPRGWKVLPLFRNIHHSEKFFPEPDKFDPSRFEVAPKPNTFLPFGYGLHSCPGGELAKLEVLVLLHHLTTKYRWQVVATESGIQYGPFPVPKQGLPMKVTLRKKRPNPTTADF